MQDVTFFKWHPCFPLLIIPRIVGICHWYFTLALRLNVYNNMLIFVLFVTSPCLHLYITAAKDWVCVLSDHLYTALSSVYFCTIIYTAKVIQVASSNMQSCRQRVFDIHTIVNSERQGGRRSFVPAMHMAPSLSDARVIPELLLTSRPFGNRQHLSMKSYSICNGVIKWNIMIKVRLITIGGVPDSHVRKTGASWIEPEQI